MLNNYHCLKASDFLCVKIIGHTLVQLFPKNGPNEIMPIFGRMSARECTIAILRILYFIGSRNITIGIIFFGTSVCGSNNWINMCLLINPVCLSFWNNWSHWNRYCCTCYRRWVCQVYGRDDVFAQNPLLCQSHIILHFVMTAVTNKIFTTYV